MCRFIIFLYIICSTYAAQAKSLSKHAVGTRTRPSQKYQHCITLPACNDDIQTSFGFTYIYIEVEDYLIFLLKHTVLCKTIISLNIFSFHLVTTTNFQDFIGSLCDEHKVENCSMDENGFIIANVLHK